MCLIVNRFRHWRLKPKIAKKDILCYKVFKIRSVEDSSYMTLTTPYQHCFTKNLEKSMIPDYFQKEVFKNERTKQNIIDHGMHSYKNIIAARNTVLELTEWRYSDSIYTIVPCYIPQGSKYWIGYGGEYCSQILKFL